MNIIEQQLYKPKYLIIFLRNHQGVYFVDGVKKIKKMKKLVKYGTNKTYPINYENIIYIRKNIRYYLVDIENSAQITLQQNKSDINPEEIDTIVSNHIVRDITKGVMNNNKEKLMYIIGGVVFGLVLGVAIMYGVMNNKITEIYESYKDYSPFDPENPFLTSFKSVIGLLKVW